MKEKNLIYPNLVFSHCWCIETSPQSSSCEVQAAQLKPELWPSFLTIYRENVRPALEQASRLPQSFVQKPVSSFLSPRSSQMYEGQNPRGGAARPDPSYPQPVMRNSWRDQFSTGEGLVDYSQALGFANLGNTCFANSVLQLLRSLPEIELVLKQDVPEGEPHREEKLQVKAQLLKLFQQVKKKRTALEKGKSPSLYGSSSFQRELNQFFDRFDEFLRARNPDHDSYFIQETREDSLGRPSRMKRYVRTHQMDADEFLRTILDVVGYQKSGFGTLKTGQKIQFMTGASRESSDSESSSALSLSIQSPSIRSVQDAVADYLKPERLTGRNQLIHPRGHKEDSVKTPFFSYDSTRGELNPLMIQLKRFDFDPSTGQTSRLRKSIDVTQHIQIPLQEKFNDHGEERIRSRTVTFYPKTVVVHLGSSPHSGHYIAYGYDQKTQTWFEYNDSHVTALRGPDLLQAMKTMNENAYLIHYQKQDE